MKFPKRWFLGIKSSPLSSSKLAAYVPWRVALLGLVILLGIGMLIFQAYQLNVKQGDRLKQSSANRLLRESTLIPRRGSIYDAQGEALAVDMYEYSVAIDPNYFFSLYDAAQGQSEAPSAGDANLTFLQQRIRQGLSLIEELGRYFKVQQSVTSERIKKQQIKQRQQQFDKQLGVVESLLGYASGELMQDLQQAHQSNPQNSFLVLRKAIDSVTAHQLQALRFKPLIVSRRYTRSYPHGESFASILGYLEESKTSRKGLDGVEKWLDSILQGRVGKRVTVNGAGGQVVAIDSISKVPKSGQDVNLTLDVRFQYALNKALKKQLIRHRARSAIGLLVEVPSGAIRAIASQPSFNPNNWAERTPARTRLRSVIDRFEPGSTQKPVLVAAAIDAGVIDADTTFNLTRKYRAPGTQVDFHENRHLGIKTVTEIVQHSINMGMVKIAAATPQQTLWQLHHRLGYLSQDYNFLTGLRGISTLSHFSAWEAIDYYVRSYGYGDEINLMEMLNLYVSIANQGLLPAIHLLQSKRHLNTDLQDYIQPQRIISASSARTMLAILEQVVLAGTGQRAQVQGYTVAGKTGTARKVQGGNYNYLYRASFVGIIPADKPKYVLAISIEEPSVSEELYAGGQVAAPVFAEVMTQVMRLSEHNFN